MTDYKSINTYPKMNETIKDLLIFQGDNYTLYAAKRIEELEAENNTLSKTAKRIEKATARECLKILHGIGGCDATEEWSKGWDAAIDEAYKEISDKYGVTAFDEEAGETYPNCCKACNYFYENEVSDGVPVCNVSSDGKTFKDCKILKENGVEDEE